MFTKLFSRFYSYVKSERLGINDDRVRLWGFQYGNLRDNFIYVTFNIDKMLEENAISECEAEGCFRANLFTKMQDVLYAGSAHPLFWGRRGHPSIYGCHVFRRLYSTGETLSDKILSYSNFDEHKELLLRYNSFFPVISAKNKLPYRSTYISKLDYMLWSQKAASSPRQALVIEYLLTADWVFVIDVQHSLLKESIKCAEVPTLGKGFTRVMFDGSFNPSNNTGSIGIVFVNCEGELIDFISQPIDTVIKTSLEAEFAALQKAIAISTKEKKLQKLDLLSDNEGIVFELSDGDKLDYINLREELKKHTTIWSIRHVHREGNLAADYCCSCVLRGAFCDKEVVKNLVAKDWSRPAFVFKQKKLVKSKDASGEEIWVSAS
ncbi:uncharacterized protein LOC132276078 isoform X2 [Cornus florida]|uniref:uncharacterized protein LOC132276078 isoform X2 n=1 Tax=Cornus florida TaxID=4283 RepID=UPI00289EF2C5|nr:uncharacterized protein LOC132276078 isoform X2 [Cornus florida]